MNVKPDCISYQFAIEARSRRGVKVASCSHLSSARSGRAHRGTVRPGRRRAEELIEKKEVSLRASRGDPSVDVTPARSEA